MRPILLLSKGFYIPAGIVVNGNFVSEKEGGIEGTINGNVQVNATLTIEKKGIINGELHAKDLIVKGHVNGNIYCEGRVCVLKDAAVEGDIFASECRIDKSSFVKGVISHINQKRGPGNNAITGDASEGISFSLLPEKIVPEEPPQSWF